MSAMGIAMQTLVTGLLEEEKMLNFNGPEDDEDGDLDDDFNLDDIDLPNDDFSDFDDDDL